MGIATLQFFVYVVPALIGAFAFGAIVARWKGYI